MKEKLKPYNVHDGKEIELRHKDTGALYAGEWAVKSMNEDGFITIGRYKNQFSENRSQPAYIPVEEFEDLTVITGSGESNKRNVTNNIAYQVMKTGSSVVQITYTEEEFRSFLDVIPEERTGDVLCISPSNSEKHNVGFNILQNPASEDHPNYEKVVSEIADSCVSLLKQGSYDWSGGRVNGLTETIVEELIRADRQFDIVDLNRIIVEEESLQAFSENYVDDVTIAFTEEVFEPVLKSVQQWTQSMIARQMTADSESEFNLYNAITSNRIVVIDFSNCRNSGVPTSFVCARLRCIDKVLEDGLEPFVFFDRFPTRNGYNSSTVSDTENIRYVMTVDKLTDYETETRGMMKNSGNVISFKCPMDRSEASTISLIHNVEPKDVLHIGGNECFSEISTTDGQKSGDSVKSSAFYPVPTDQNLGITELKDRTSEEFGSESDAHDLDKYGASRFLE